MHCVQHHHRLQRSSREFSGKPPLDKKVHCTFEGKGVSPLLQDFWPRDN